MIKFQIEQTKIIRNKLRLGDASIGSWMQIPNSSVAEIMGRAGFDWVVADLEHGSVSLERLPDIFRALALGGTLPLVRTADKSKVACQSLLDAGAGGIVFANVDDAEELENLVSACQLPPGGTRGVGFSRANLFGHDFETFLNAKTDPLIIAMIESQRGVDALEKIIDVKGLDAIFIGPYDLSASLKKVGNFDSEQFLASLEKIKGVCRSKAVPTGLHVVKPESAKLKDSINDGFCFIAYSIDAVFLNNSLDQSFRTRFHDYQV